MSNKYQFDPETLSYKEVRFGMAKNLEKKHVTLFAAAIVIAIGSYLLGTFLISSPVERNLKRENAQLKLQYKILEKRMVEAEKVLYSLQERDDNIYRVVFEAEPMHQSVRNAGFGGANKYKHLETFDNSKLLIETTKRLDKLSKQLVIQSKSYDEIVELVKQKEEMLECIPAIRPIAAGELTRFSSKFGMRIHPIYKVPKMHTGIDLSAPHGTKIYSAGSGKVIRADWGQGYGYHVIIDHGYGYKTVYAHMNEIIARKGQQVKRGEVIGTVGATGLAVAAHLHYEVRKDDRPVNPINYYINELTPEEYAEMVKISQNSN